MILVDFSLTQSGLRIFCRYGSRQPKKFWLGLNTSNFLDLHKIESKCIYVNLVFLCNLVVKFFLLLLFTILNSIRLAAS